LRPRQADTTIYGLFYGKYQRALFVDDDPQGTAVDKVFRMEKYVPSDSIGMLQEFVDRAKPDSLESAGRYRLRGLADGRQQLWVVVGSPSQYPHR